MTVVIEFIFQKQPDGQIVCTEGREHVDANTFADITAKIERWFQKYPEATVATATYRSSSDDRRD